jgi:hypothetical protein
MLLLLFSGNECRGLDKGKRREPPAEIPADEAQRRASLSRDILTERPVTLSSSTWGLEHCFKLKLHKYPVSLNSSPSSCYIVSTVYAN